MKPSYSFSRNLFDWMLCALIMIVLGLYLPLDQYPEIAWLHGIMFGCMFAWAVDIGNEWIEKIKSYAQVTKD